MVSVWSVHIPAAQTNSIISTMPGDHCHGDQDIYCTWDCVCVCVRERAQERERERVREKEAVCERKRERQRGRVCVCVCVCVCVWVCVWWCGGVVGWLVVVGVGG